MMSRRSTILLAVCFSVILPIIPGTGVYTIYLRSLAIVLLSALAVTELIKTRGPRSSTVKFWLMYIGCYAAVLLFGPALLGSSASNLLGLSKEGFGVVALIGAMILGYYLAVDSNSNTGGTIYYAAICIAVTSIIIGLPTIFTGARITGLVGQSGLLATVLGVGLICGYYHMANRSVHKYDYLGMGSIFVALVATQSRSALYFVIGAIIYITVIRVHHRYRATPKVKLWLFVSAGVCVVVTSAILILPSRIKNLTSLEYGVRYRSQLVTMSVQPLVNMPPWGYGSGMLSDVYRQYPLPPLVQKSLITDNAITESSHNGPLDLLLEYGWIAFTLYVVALLGALYVGFGNRDKRTIRVTLVILCFMIIQEMVNPSWLLGTIFIWLSILTIYLEAGVPKLPSNRLAHGSLLIILVSLVILVPIQLWLDGASALRRVEQNFHFPLSTTKDQLAAGSHNNKGVLTWRSYTYDNYHHDYPAADLHVAKGTEVLVAKGGIVELIRDKGCNGTAQFPIVIIRGDDGFNYLYAHLLPGSILAVVGDTITAGDGLARVGGVECAEGAAPHLHIDITRYDWVNRDGWFTDILMPNVQSVLVDKYQDLPQN